MKQEGIEKYAIPHFQKQIFTLSKVMGCSAKYIEEYYGQIQTEKMTDYISPTKSTMDGVDALILD